MAGNHDGNRVVPERLTDGPAAARLPDAPGDLAVRDDLARRHPRRRQEHAALERRDVAQVEAHVEAPPLAGEVIPQLLDDIRRPDRRAHHVGLRVLPELVHERLLAVLERDPQESGVARRHEHAADRSRDGTPVDRGTRQVSTVEAGEIRPRPAIALELLASLCRPEPTPGRSRAITEQLPDQLVVMNRHRFASLRRAPPSVARSFLMAW